MRKIVLFMSVSLDGFIEGPERQLDWHQVDDELHGHFNEELARMGGFLNGRGTYELMAGFWPTADADPANAGPVAEFAVIWRRMPKIVFSRTMERAGWNTAIRREVDPEEIAVLKRQPGGDLALGGGAELIGTFMRHDLIDEYRIYLHPVVIGRGHQLFSQVEALKLLHLAEHRVFGNGVVLLRYRRQAAASA